MTPEVLPTPRTPGKQRKWLSWRMLTVSSLLLLGFLAYVAYGAREAWRIAAAHTKLGLASGQLDLFAHRIRPEPLTLETVVRSVKEDRWDVGTDGTHYVNVMQTGDRLVFYTFVLHAGFWLDRVVLVTSKEEGSVAIPEAEFLARKKAGNL